MGTFQNVTPYPIIFSMNQTLQERLSNIQALTSPSEFNEIKENLNKINESHAVNRFTHLFQSQYNISKIEKNILKEKNQNEKITLSDIVDEVMIDTKIDNKKRLKTNLQNFNNKGTTSSNGLGLQNCTTLALFNKHENAVNKLVSRPKHVCKNKFTDVEAKLFYRGIQMFGTDISMIHHMYLHHKSHKQVNRFFKRENIKNREKIDLAILWNRKNRMIISEKISEMRNEFGFESLTYNRELEGCKGCSKAREICNDISLGKRGDFHEEINIPSLDEVFEITVCEFD